MSGRIILSCGHESELNGGFGLEYVIESMDREGHPCLSFGVCCERCIEDYARLGILVDDVERWETEHWDA